MFRKMKNIWVLFLITALLCGQFGRYLDVFASGSGFFASGNGIFASSGMWSEESHERESTEEGSAEGESAAEESAAQKSTMTESTAGEDSDEESLVEETAEKETIEENTTVTNDSDTGETSVRELTENKAQSEEVAESLPENGEDAADNRIVIAGFEDFDVYKAQPYKTIYIGSVDGNRSYLILPAVMRVCLLSGDAQGDIYTQAIPVRWSCDEWDDVRQSAYTFTMSFDEESYVLNPDLRAAIAQGEGSLPFIEVHIKRNTAGLRSYNPNPQIPAIIVNNGLIYIPGTTTSTYDFSVNGKRAFCMQHPIPSAVNGSVLTPAIYDNENIQKVLYYGYGGVEQYPEFSSEAAGIVMTSLALSYFYMGDFNFAPTWVGGAYGSYSQSIGFDKFLDYIKNQPYKSGIADMSFSNASVQAYVENGKQRTEEITFNYADSEYICMTLPENVTLVNITRNTYSTGSAVIYGKDRFYFQAPMSQQGVWSSGQLTGSFGKYMPILCVTDSNTQDVGYGEWVEDKDHTVELSVTWTSGRDMDIVKIDESTGKALAGAGLKLTDSDGNTVDTWLSTDVPRTIKGLEVGKSYTLTETKAPSGYLLMDPVTFTVENGSGTQKIVCKNKQTEYHFTKQDVAQKQILPGALLKISEKKTGKLIDQWVSDAQPHPVLGLVPGTTYLFTEITPAAGYASAEHIEFTVSTDKNVQTVTMVDDYTKVEIIKTDIDKKTPVKGAVLELKDSSGNILDTWKTDGKPHRIDKLVVGESYVICETEPAPGYVTAKEVSFTVKDTAQVQTVEMVDDYTKVDFIKTDIVTGDSVEGATLAIYGVKDGKADERSCLATWVTTKEAHRINYLPLGSYILRETLAPESQGYVTGEDVPFTVTDSGVIVKVEMKNDHTRVEVYKTDASDGKPVVGATLAIYPVDAKGEPNLEQCIDTWVSDEKPHALEYIPVGNYILRELQAPVKDGYASSGDVAFSVSNTSDVQRVEMKDEYTKIKVVKMDKESREILPGAHLEVLDSDGNLVDAWVSDGSAHEILRLSPGEDYVLTETVPPAGYLTSKPVAFTVKDTADIQTICMEDEKTVIHIEKRDLESQEMLSGAHLRLTDSNGEIVDEWISDGKPHEITLLVVGECYCLVETLPPSGYATAAPVEFTVEDRAGIQTVAMHDDFTKILVEKVDAQTKKGLDGAELLLKNQKGEIVRSWTSKSSGDMVEKLNIGENYTIEELGAPENYTIGSPVQFVVEDSSDVQKICIENVPYSEEKTDIPPAPKTGDNFPTVPIAVAAGISMMAMVAAGICIYRRKH